MFGIPVINSETVLEALFERSRNEPVLVFKHSLICPVSTAAHRRFARFIELRADVACGLIEIQRNRELSKLVEQRTGVRHESPQAILLSAGRAVWHASHGAIDEQSLEASLGLQGE